jgi:hypothetical protein
MNRDDAKKKAKELAQRAEQAAADELAKVEAKWPLGTAITFLVIGIVIGAYLWSLWPHK